jgi:hypothetical protein
MAAAYASCVYIALSQRVLGCSYNIHDFVRLYQPAFVKYRPNGAIQVAYYVFEISVAVRTSSDKYIFMHEEFCSNVFTNSAISKHVTYMRTMYGICELSGCRKQDTVIPFLKTMTKVYNIAHFYHNNNQALMVILKNSVFCPLFKCDDADKMCMMKRGRKQVHDQIYCRRHVISDTNCTINTVLSLVVSHYTPDYCANCSSPQTAYVYF